MEKKPEQTPTGSAKITSSDKDWRNCKNCGSTPMDHEVRNFDVIWRMGDVYCTICESYVRVYDAS